MIKVNSRQRDDWDALPLILGLIILALLEDNRIEWFTDHAPMTQGIQYCVVIIICAILAKWIKDKRSKS